MKKELKIISIFIVVMLISILDVSALETNGIINKDDVENDTYIIGNFMFNHKQIDDDDYIGDDIYNGTLFTEYLMLSAGTLNNQNGNKDEMKIYYKDLHGDWKNPINDDPLSVNQVPNQFYVLYLNNKLIFELKAPVYGVDFSVGPDGIYEGNTAIYFADLIHETNEYYDTLNRLLGDKFNISEINVYYEDEEDENAGKYDHNRFRVPYKYDIELRFSYTIQLPNGVVETPKSDIVSLRAELSGTGLKIASEAYDGFEQAAIRGQVAKVDYAAYIPLVDEYDESSIEETDTEYIYRYGVDKVPYLIYAVKLHENNIPNLEYIDSSQNIVKFEVYDADTDKRISKMDAQGNKISDALYNDVITVPVEVGKTRNIYAKLYIDCDDGVRTYGYKSNELTIGNNIRIPKTTGIRIKKTSYTTQSEINYIKYLYEPVYDYEYDYRVIGKIHDEYAPYTGLSLPVDVNKSSQVITANSNEIVVPFGLTNEIITLTSYIQKADGTKITTPISYTTQLFGFGEE